MSKLPGTRPLAPSNWIHRDEAFCAQMAYRDHLLGNFRDQTTAKWGACDTALAELHDTLVDHLRNDPSYTVSKNSVTRPDGVTVPLDRPVLEVIGRLTQSDFCLVEAEPPFRLVAGVLCFPASWLLTEKLGRPMQSVHDRVTPYDEDMGGRVERMFSRLRPGQILWRANYLTYEDPDLFQPRSETAPRLKLGADTYVRAERQTLRRLHQPFIAFGIHTFVVRNKPI